MNQVSPCFGKKNFILPFAVNVMLNLSIIEPPLTTGSLYIMTTKPLSFMRARKSFELYLLFHAERFTF